MNTNKNMLTRLSTSTVGRALRRIFGDECGQGMMEYVIIAVVIAAACALIFAIWGQGIHGQAKAGAQAAVINPNKAAQTVLDNRNVVEKGASEAKKHVKKVDGDVGNELL